MGTCQMTILSPVDVKWFHVNPKHPHHNPALLPASCKWVVMVDGAEVKNCIHFDKVNRFAKYVVTDERGMIKLKPEGQRKRGRGEALIAIRKGDVHVFTTEGAL